MRKKITLYIVNIFLGVGTSFVICLFFSCWEMFIDCFRGHDAFCIVTFLMGYPLPWHLFQWPLLFLGLLFGLPGGIIAGLIGSFLDSRFAKTTLHEIGFSLLTVILSGFLSSLIINWFKY